MKAQLYLKDPYIVNVKDLLYEDECDGITAAVRNKLDTSDDQMRKLYKSNSTYNM